MVTDRDFYIILASLVIFFFLLGTGITIFVWFYYKKRRLHLREKDEIRQNFERSLLQSQLEIQEQSFNSISQEIHDNVGQILSLCKVQLNIIEQTTNPRPVLLGDVKENISKAMCDLRDIAKSLNSERLKLLPLSKALAQETERINRTNLISAEVCVKGVEKEIGIQEKLILYRVVQEGLQNILKHAGATKIELELDYLPGHLRTTIRDNGSGFYPEIENGKGLGLQNMYNRTALIKGQLSIHSVIDTGTTIIITIPYN